MSICIAVESAPHGTLLNARQNVDGGGAWLQTAASESALNSTPRCCSRFVIVVISSSEKRSVG